MSASETSEMMRNFAKSLTETDQNVSRNFGDSEISVQTLISADAKAVEVNCRDNIQDLELDHGTSYRTISSILQQGYKVWDLLRSLLVRFPHYCQEAQKQLRVRCCNDFLGMIRKDSLALLDE